MSTPRAARVDSVQRRAQLLDVAADLVASGGVRALTMEAVAEKAGVHRPVVYRHFDNADELLEAVIQRDLAELRQASVDAMEGVTGLEPRLRASVAAWFAHFARSGTVSSAALSQPPTTEALQAQRREQNRFSARFMRDELTAAGLDIVDAEILAAVMLTGLTGLVRMWRAKRISRAVAIDRFVVITMGAAAALGSSAR